QPSTGACTAGTRSQRIRAIRCLLRTTINTTRRHRSAGNCSWWPCRSSAPSDLDRRSDGGSQDISCELVDLGHGQRDRGRGALMHMLAWHRSVLHLPLLRRHVAVVVAALVAGSAAARLSLVASIAANVAALLLGRRASNSDRELVQIVGFVDRDVFGIV